MAESAKNSIRKQFSDQIPIEIEVVKEPSHMTIGNASGLMYERYFPGYFNTVDFVGLLPKPRRVVYWQQMHWENEINSHRRLEDKQSKNY